MSNIIKAIINIANEPIVQLRDSYTSRNTINNIGQALEAYMQDAFANTISEPSPQKRNERINEVFSYLGNQNNPPDIILKDGDAIEVKKIQSKGAAIALNSSYPKSKLHSDDSKITDACRDCEDWTAKDIIYAIGVTSDQNLKHLWLVYGDCYAASREIYTRIGKTIKEGVKEIEDIEFSETKELGRVNRVDPLGITNLRIRGMWHIDNPLKVYKDYYEANETKTFSLACIIREDKFLSFNSSDIDSLYSHNDIAIKDIEIKDPDNPAKLLNAKLITLEVS
ncbi:NgoPII family restriction endonuclease [Cycloclasticus sp. P1]|uniref:NgoPII family restriction endonuclease n=1 Tax=Cycloclasticus sp. (strain P1) TaxID=385025 RepID=UPI000286A9BD|nr:NgoPII family restriction endonuclease [Cycloclasticus sp. P1]AFT66178.1 NgoII restriction endonuclease R.NgoII [Cycloclasticus sp. P1]